MKTNRITRRGFLMSSAMAAAAGWAWNPFHAFGETRTAANIGLSGFNLNGSWEFSRAGTEGWFPAMVPGCIHTDLLAAGKIPDPFYRDNERFLQWIGEADWFYRRTFDVPAGLLRHDRVLLHCAGLDTLATIRINGTKIGYANNMFRTWEFDVRSLLKPGKNRIEIFFASPLAYMRERQSARVLYEWVGPHEPRGRAWVRKEPCNFGWDWAPVLITCGIWRNIGLLAFDHARIADVATLQDHSTAGKVGLQIDVAAEVVRATPLQAAVTVRHHGQTLHSSTVPLSNGSARVRFEIKDPKLWWPAGMGGQTLYEVNVELRDDSGLVLDRTTRRIGLRTLKLLPPDRKASLRFEVNGVPFFAKGANLVPADVFATRVTPEILRRLTADAVAVNMNSLRFWGGGYYEDDALFDACDELGICVWMDFKFACSSYPAFDDAFMANVKQEARDQLRRLRHHPCIAVWCGNNEVSLMVKKKWSCDSMGQADYDKLFKKLLGGQVKELAPQANYVSGSPECGDVHFWKVWHGGQPFEAFRSVTGFMSEFGFQSFPEPKTVRAYTNETDRASVVSPVMQWHERSGTNGLEKILDLIPRYFNPPRDFDSTLWLSQIMQGMGIKMGAEHWRRTMPRSMGCLFWQYDDCWPVASWSSVDYFGRWKALHYLARRFYAPLLVSGRANSKRGTVELHVTSDRLEACHGVVEWRITGADGNILDGGHTGVEIPPRQSRKIKTLSLRQHIQKQGSDDVLVWLTLSVDEQAVSDNLVTLVPPKDLHLTDPQLKTSIATAGEGFLVTVSAAKPALWSWLDLHDLDAKYSDNFFHLVPGSPMQIRVQPRRPMTEASFAKALRARSLFDACPTVHK